MIACLLSFAGGLLVAVITLSLCTARHEADCDAKLIMISQQAREELARIERDGGHTGFPERILAIIWV